MNLIHSEEHEFDSIIKIGPKFILFKVLNETYQPIPDGIFTPFVIFRTEFNGEVILQKRIETKICDINDFTEHEIKQINSNISSFLCITPPEEYSDIRYERDPIYINYLGIYITKCTISPYFNINYCLSEEDRNKYIDNNSIIFEYVLPADYVDNKSTKRPVVKSYKRSLKYIPKGSILETIKLNKIFYESDDGIIFSKNKKYEGVKIYEAEDTYQDHPIPNEVLGNIHYCLEILSSDYLCVKYIRSYDKFEDFLATIGGLLNLFYYLLKIITFMFTRGFYFKDLILLPTKEKYLMDRKDKSKEISELNNYLNKMFKKDSTPEKLNGSNDQNNKLITAINNSQDILNLKENKNNFSLFNPQRSKTAPINKNNSITGNPNVIVDKDDNSPPPNIQNTFFNAKKKIFLVSQINCWNSFSFSICPCCVKNRKIYLLRTLRKLVSYYLSSDELVFNNMKLDMFIQNLKNDQEKKNFGTESKIYNT